MFAGGCNVGLNVKANKIICNDIIYPVIDFFNGLKEMNESNVIKYINNIINTYGLTKINKEGYNSFRNYYNSCGNKNPLDFFILTCFSFNYGFKFNSKHEFNESFGNNRSYFNKNIENRLIQTIEKVHNSNINFTSKDFEYFPIEDLSKNDFVYCDPPYLISTVPYIDGKRGFRGWSSKEELILYDKLDFLNEKGIRFAFSNVIENKGLKNDLLLKWLNKYKVVYLNSNYANCNKDKKEKINDSTEVLIINY